MKEKTEYPSKTYRHFIFLLYTRVQTGEEHLRSELDRCCINLAKKYLKHVPRSKNVANWLYFEAVQSISHFYTIFFKIHLNIILSSTFPKIFSLVLQSKIINNKEFFYEFMLNLDWTHEIMLSGVRESLSTEWINLVILHVYTHFNISQNQKSNVFFVVVQRYMDGFFLVL